MKPAWLNKKINIGACLQMRHALRGAGVETVCEQALCPNIGECFSRGRATFLILGRQCTRSCSFCNVKKGVPQEPDYDEPRRVAEAVERLGLRHVVVTSVTRDDLCDGGAGIFAETVARIRRRLPQTTIELLIPDFQCSLEALRMVAAAAPDIIAHNIETVPSLYPLVRRGATYRRSLDVLRIIRERAPRIKTKSGIMVGLGERQEEIIEVMRDLRLVGCDFLSIGQYLAPSRNHFPVREYVDPAIFLRYKDEAYTRGFVHVESAPYVRSSYAAEDYLHAKDGNFRIVSYTGGHP